MEKDWIKYWDREVIVQIEKLFGWDQHDLVSQNFELFLSTKAVMDELFGSLSNVVIGVVRTR